MRGNREINMKMSARSAVAGLLFAMFTPLMAAQSSYEMDQLTRIPAVSGYEQGLAETIRAEIGRLSPKKDNLGNVFVTVGTGAPHRLIVTPIDEPGYVVSDITSDGYIRVQRLPQAPPNGVFDLLHAAQPVWILTRGGKKVTGVFAGLSIHLQPLRQNPPKMAHPDEMYIDIGASSAEEVHTAGVNLLDPVTLSKDFPLPIGPGVELAGPAVGDRFGAAILLELLRRFPQAKVSGTLTVAFVTQQWTGGRGLDRLLNELHPDEMIYVGRLQTQKTSPVAAQNAPLPGDGSGILLQVSDSQAPLTGFAGELKKLAAENHLSLTPVVAAPPRIAGYVKPTPMPGRFAELGVATRWPVTPAEVVSSADSRNLESFLEAYLHLPKPDVGHGESSSSAERDRSTLQSLVEAYGPSGHEGMVREEVKKLLPEWAKPETDDAGNLVLHLGDAKASAKTPRIAIVAHMDEIGYQIRSIEQDGRLLVDFIGGGYTEYFLGHAVLVHTEKGSLGGVLELPEGWDKPGFEWPHLPRSMQEPAHVYVGTHSAAETEKLGIKVGDWLTIPKKYRTLLGTRANGRSFDDRVGCAALVEAVKALGPSLPGRDVTFVWSTEEEIGLKGAAAYAERTAKEGKAPDFVFAVDTFVSSDSPLESKRFADAELGKGFVVRAVDNSNITPREYVDRVVQLARENHIPAQFGVTGGGNDGAVFARYGSINIPLGWPLRYAHSPGEVIDTRDYHALARIIAVLAKNW
jgi:putative aminopeptidase